MKERPIVLSGPEVRDVLAGRKRQLRREVDLEGLVPKGFSAIPYPTGVWAWTRACPHRGGHMRVERAGNYFPCPYGVVGDALWVQEEWGPGWHHAQPSYFHHATDDLDGYADFDGWRPADVMPRAASRLSLRVTEVRIERICDISPWDAAREGSEPTAERSARGEFARLWDEANGKGAFGRDPFVWVVSFERIEVPRG